MTKRGVLIGCGYISQRQLTAWQQIDEAKIVAVCDLEAGEDFALVVANFSDFTCAVDSSWASVTRRTRASPGGRFGQRAARARSRSATAAR